MHRRTSTGDPESRRRAVLVAHAAALAAVDPATATRRALAVHAPDGETPPITIIAMGKAAIPMTEGALRVLGTRVIGGIAVGTGDGDPIGPVEVSAGDHPYPGRRSAAAGEAVAATARAAPGTVVFLISGGASSLVELPVDGLTIDDLAATSELLLEGGVDIHRLNTVRTALSALKGGGLRRMVAAASTMTLLVSDVIGDDPATIASGPTVEPDPDGTSRARTVLVDAGVWDRVPAPVQRQLGTHRGPNPDWPYDDMVEVIATGRLAAEAAARSLETSTTVHLHTTPLDGDAIEAAIEVTARPGPGVHVGFGETTVTVAGSGVGGRNQHAALAAAMRIAGSGGVFAALSTDGIDGASNAAGAIVDGGTVARCIAAGVDPERELRACNSTSALAASGDLVETGPTGTNVGDLWIWWP